MKRLKNGLILILVIALIGIASSGKLTHKSPAQNNFNEQGRYQLFMYYDTKTGKIYATGYDHFTYGLDSSQHVINVKNGKNRFYFILYDMSIEFEITKYDE